MWIIGERVGKNIGDRRGVLLSLRYPSIGSHRWLYLGGGVGVCEVYSDEGWAGASSVGVESPEIIAAGEAHADDEFVSVSVDVPVSGVRHCAFHSFAVFESGVKDCA